jgi:hypothetical protein
MDEGDRATARTALQQALAGRGEVDREDIQRRLAELDTPQRIRRR